MLFLGAPITIPFLFKAVWIELDNLSEYTKNKSDKGHTFASSAILVRRSSSFECI